ncbi:Glucanosyltransferase-domain-containing protein [Bombardia bombarda]|uniref:1,3-beta-glucanosyltransferase n=1 Tax=Bombardia bombarda TaxID=252184 RepID=A0AA39XIX6_9PEZI|nr:Glucanosyltransferase-domain-containing protein [Bombardia bombarda]
MLIQSALLALGATAVAALKPLTVKDNNFVDESGNRFQIVGVAYQPGGSAAYDPLLNKDPLSHKDTCLRDAALLQILGVNAIRVYNLNPNVNHDECASIFNAAGMYMLLDVNSPFPGESLTDFNPWESYYDTYLNRTFAVVEAFKDYPNTLAFFSGNEVISNVNTTEFVPRYVRAVTRDLKNYVAKHASRPIPVGYSAADVRTALFDSFNYFQCSIEGEDDDMSRADLFALNSYSWCGDSSFEQSSYDKLVQGLSDNSVPVFFSEYGCNQVKPRIFTEVGTIYGPEMTGVFSGGIVYEYSQEENDFGLVNISSDGTVDLLSDFYAFQSQLAKLDFTTLEGSKPAGSAPKPPVCSSKLITTPKFDNNFTLPVEPPNVQGYIDNGIKPVPSGKLVDISDFTVSLAVRNSDGSVLTNLAVKQLDGPNQPGSNKASSTPWLGWYGQLWLDEARIYISVTLREILDNYAPNIPRLRLIISQDDPWL